MAAYQDIPHSMSQQHQQAQHKQQQELNYQQHLYNQHEQQHQQQQHYMVQQHQHSSPAQYYSIDVEAVATGTDHNSRSVAQISLVDEHRNVLLNLYVQPDVPVISYITPLTGLTAQQLQDHGMPLAQALQILRATLPRHATLVGQSIGQDVKWLGLKEGTDFAGLMDLAGLYRCWNSQYNSWSVFSQDHVAKVLLDWQPDESAESEHGAVQDAIKSIDLFLHHRNLAAQPGALEAAQQALMAAPPTVPFKRRHPTYEGVCMGLKKECTCGAPFLFN